MINENKFLDFNCLRCGGRWRSRLSRPSCCPKCRRPDWDKSKVLKRNDALFINTLAQVGETLFSEPLKAWRNNETPRSPQEVDWQYMKTKKDTVIRKCKKLGIIANWSFTYAELRVFRAL